MNENYSKGMTEEKRRIYMQKLITKEIMVQVIAPMNIELSKMEKIVSKINFSAASPKSALSVSTEYR